MQENANLQQFHGVILYLLKHGSDYNYFFAPSYGNDSDDEQYHFHVYENEQWDKVKHLGINAFHWPAENEPYPVLSHYPLVNKPDCFLDECSAFLDQIPPRRISGVPEEVDTWGPILVDDYMNYFFPEVLIPMVHAYLQHKKRKYEDCYKFLAQIKAKDWQRACVEWVTRRETAWRNKNGK